MTLQGQYFNQLKSDILLQTGCYLNQCHTKKQKILFTVIILFVGLIGPKAISRYCPFKEAFCFTKLPASHLSVFQLSHFTVCLLAKFHVRKICGCVKKLVVFPIPLNFVKVITDTQLQQSGCLEPVAKFIVPDWRF